MKFDYQERIDNYVQGEMTADERNAFEEELKANDELREQLEYTQKVKSLVSDREEKMRALREWIHEDDEEEMMVASAQYRPTGTECYAPNECTREIAAASDNKKKRKVWFWVSGIAAILVVGFFAIQPNFVQEDVLRSPNGQFRGDEGVFAPNDSVSQDSIDKDTIYNISNEYEE